MKGRYNDISSNRKRSSRQDQPSGSVRGAPHPNGGEVERLEIPRSKMPENSSSGPVTHTALKVDLGKMPKQHSAPTERDPRRR